MHLLQDGVIRNGALGERAGDLEEPLVRAELLVGAQHRGGLIAINCRAHPGIALLGLGACGELQQDIALRQLVAPQLGSLRGPANHVAQLAQPGVQALYLLVSGHDVWDSSGDRCGRTGGHAAGCKQAKATEEAQRTSHGIRSLHAEA